MNDAYSSIVAAPPTKALFWQTFSAAFVCYAATVLVLIAVYLDGVELVALLLPACVFGLWAAKAPRGAAIGLVAVIALGTLNNVSFALTSPWRFLLLPVEIIAIVLGVHSVGIAKTYLDGQRRRQQAAADYDLEHRWQQD